MKPLTRIKQPLYYFDSLGKRHDGPNPNLRGNCSGLRGDCSDLRGDCSGLLGYCSYLQGDCSGLRGDCSGLQGDLNEIPNDQRPCDIKDGNYPLTSSKNSGILILDT